MNAGTLTCYRMCGLTIASELPLVELRAFDTERPADCELHAAAALPSAIAAACAAHDKHHGFVCFELDAELIVHLEGAATIVVDAANRSLTAVSHDGDLGVLSHLVVDHAVPRLLTRRGAAVLHATAVELDGRAVGFLGATGAGKSTMAFSFVRNGARLLADDCFVADLSRDPIEVIPSYQGGRLWSDSAEALALAGSLAAQSAGDKPRLELDDAGAHTPIALAALFVLERGGDTVAIDELSPADAFWCLATNAFVFDLFGDQMTRLGRIVDTTPIYRLAYPSDFGRLAEVHTALSQRLTVRR